MERDEADKWAADLRAKSRADVLATITDHCDRGDGWCMSPFHRGDPRRHPCSVRLHHEGVLNAMRRDPLTP